MTNSRCSFGISKPTNDLPGITSTILTLTTDSDRAGSSLRVHEWLQSNPFVTSNQLVDKIGLSAPTVNAALADLERLGIVTEVTGKRRNRV